MRTIHLISFGYLHLHGAPPPEADRVEDVRGRLRDPAAARDVLDMDGRHPRVQEIVFNTPGARELLANLADYASLPAGPSVIATGCAGGKHRSAALTELLARELRERGHDVVIEHRHIHLPRVLGQATLIREGSAVAAARAGRQLELDGVEVTASHPDIGEPAVGRGTEKPLCPGRSAASPTRRTVPGTRSRSRVTWLTAPSTPRCSAPPTIPPRRARGS